MANFGPISRGKLHYLEVNHCILSILDIKVTGSLIAREGPIV